MKIPNIKALIAVTLPLIGAFCIAAPVAHADMPVSDNPLYPTTSGLPGNQLPGGETGGDPYDWNELFPPPAIDEATCSRSRCKTSAWNRLRTRNKKVCDKLPPIAGGPWALCVAASETALAAELAACLRCKLP